jgi:hypothetical protein
LSIVTSLATASHEKAASAYPDRETPPLLAFSSDLSELTEFPQVSQGKKECRGHLLLSQVTTLAASGCLAELGHRRLLIDRVSRQVDEWLLMAGARFELAALA